MTNPILDSFRARFAHNPAVNELTPFGFYEAGWHARNSEVEQLRADLATKTEDCERMWSALQAETTTSVQVRGELRTEIDRLRAALRHIREVAEVAALRQGVCRSLVVRGGDPPGA